jgi:hypothetical protein
MQQSRKKKMDFFFTVGEVKQSLPWQKKKVSEHFKKIV